ncbi:response regulator [Candidatus Uhrbacteria bacterium]|jgi:two-component system, cell cycle sensor histidine kinase and response regulator CckA|nr:response regulator [Candidatus Uhrbacteria bacterium]
MTQAQVKTSEGTPSPTQPPPRHVLVVDDDDAVRRMLVEFLCSQGYRVTEAPDGEQALAILLEQPGQFNVVLSDIRMPVLCGARLLTQVRETHSLTIPFIFLSGGCSDDQRDAIQEHQATMLEKPCKLRDIATHLQAVAA